jgi:hypothetical protein
MFYHHPRYDCALVRLDDGFAFVQLVHLFAIFIDGQPLAIALVHFFDRQISTRHARKDKDMCFLRLRQQDKTCFIWARSIIRGVPIFPAFDDEKDFIVFDVVDADMFLRVSEMLGSSSC